MIFNMAGGGGASARIAEQGNPVTVTSKYNQMLQEIKLFGKTTVENGVMTDMTLYSWTRAGRNIFDPEVLTSTGFVLQADGTYVADPPTVVYSMFPIEGYLGQFTLSYRFYGLRGGTIQAVYTDGTNNQSVKAGTAGEWTSNYLTTNGSKTLSGIRILSYRNTEVAKLADISFIPLTSTQTIQFDDAVLGSVGDVQDYIEWDGWEWTFHKLTERIDSYGGEEIQGDYISSTGGLNEGASVRYVLSTPVVERIRLDTPRLFAGSNYMMAAADPIDPEQTVAYLE